MTCSTRTCGLSTSDVVVLRIALHRVLGEADGDAEDHRDGGEGETLHVQLSSCPDEAPPRAGGSCRALLSLRLMSVDVKRPESLLIAARLRALPAQCVMKDGASRTRKTVAKSSSTTISTANWREPSVTSGARGRADTRTRVGVDGRRHRNLH